MITWFHSSVHKPLPATPHYLPADSNGQWVLTLATDTHGYIYTGGDLMRRGRRLYLWSWVTKYYTPKNAPIVYYIL